MSHDEDLTKIVVDLPNHWAAGGEGIWAKRLAGDLYEIRNVPFHAYGLNFGDVVRAVEPSADRKPVVIEVVRAGGHRTLRVIFPDEVPETRRLELVASLAPFGADFERGTATHFALDIEPDGDYVALCERLDGLKAQGLLDYETCEPRAAGRFDDGPEDETT